MTTNSFQSRIPVRKPTQTREKQGAVTTNQDKVPHDGYLDRLSDVPIGSSFSLSYGSPASH